MKGKEPLWLLLLVCFLAGCGGSPPPPIEAAKPLISSGKGLHWHVTVEIRPALLGERDYLFTVRLRHLTREEVNFYTLVLEVPLLEGFCQRKASSPAPPQSWRPLVEGVAPATLLQPAACRFSAPGPLEEDLWPYLGNWPWQVHIVWQSKTALEAGTHVYDEIIFLPGQTPPGLHKGQKEEEGSP
ncbi:MAG: hypothetical protein QJR00_02645 [Bacillota bacterium]|nr:hypothetical protein [Bacillota bacterium]